MKRLAIVVITTTMILVACRKNDYYADGGLSRQPEEEKRMQVYDFLASRSNHMFDSLVKIIDLTNSKALVNSNNITFFAASNNSVLRLQMNYNPDDRQTPKPLAEIGKDTLLTLLKRFIITNNRITLEQAVKDKKKYYPDNNGDSLFIYGVGGGVAPGTSLQTSAYSIQYEHRKIPNIDSVNYTGYIQTHNLVTANAMVHVLTNGTGFPAGYKLKYYR